MNKEIPCYIISDLLPLYQDDLLSQHTKKDIDQHVRECKDCKKEMDAIKLQLDLQTADGQLQAEPLRKVRFYQKTLTVLGAVIAFILGACYPIAILGLTVLERGTITDYQIERIKGLWYVFVLRSFVSGIIVCAIYFLLLLLIRKMIRNSAA